MKESLKRKFFLTIAGLLVVFLSNGQLNINHYMRVGQTRISIGNYVGAIEYFNIVIRFRPHMPEPYFFRGIAKQRLEDFQGAIIDFDKATDIKPFFADAYAYRAMAWHELKEYDKAIADYKKALELEPENEGIYINRGIARISMKDIDGAMEDYNKALEINPSSTIALMNRSNARIIKGDTRGAIQDLNQVIIIRPHFSGAYLNRGLARFELNDYASALRDFDQSIRLEPGNALAYNNRGIIKHKLEDYNGAIMDYDMAIKLDPGMANAYFNRAMAREVLRRPGYQEDYQIAADLNPYYDLSRFSLAADQGSQTPAGQTPSQSSQTSPPDNNSNDDQKPEKSEPLSPEKAREEEIRRRRRLNLIISDTRNVKQDDPENSMDPFVQNLNIEIDLQPLFLIAAYDKNSINYERLQYYNADIEQLNIENNYNPLLTFTNKPADGSATGNFILFFNEKIGVAENSHNFLNRGIFHCLNGDYNLAIEDLTRAADLEPDNPLTFLTRGTSRFKMSEHIETIPEYSTSSVMVSGREQPPGSSKVSAQRVIIDYDLILDDYSKALSLRPDLYFGYYNRAFIYLRQKKFELALKDLDKAIELEPEFAEAYFNRGLTKIFLDDNKAGALDLSQAGELGLVGAYSVIKRYCN